MNPIDVLMIFIAATLIMSLLGALADGVVGQFIAGFFESVGCLFTKRGREQIRRFGWMGSKRR